MHVRILLLALLSAGCGPSARVLLQRGIEAELDLHTGGAADSYEAACLGGQGIACLLFERVSTAVRPTRAEYERGQTLYEADCAAGDGKACFRFGMLHDDEGGMGLETTRAIGLYERACELGYEYACQRAAELYVVTRGWDISVADTRALCERSCDAGYGRACVVLADLVKSGKGGPRSRPRSRELLRLACARGQADACIRLAKRTVYRARSESIGLPEDARADLEPLAGSAIEGCLLGHAAACKTAETLLGAALPEPQEERLGTLQDAMAAATRRAEASAAALREARAAQLDDAATFHESYWVRRCFDEDAGMTCFRVTGERRDEALERGERLMRETVARWAEDWYRQCDEAGIPFGCVKLVGAFDNGLLPDPGDGERARLGERGRRLVEELRERWRARSDPAE